MSVLRTPTSTRFDLPGGRLVWWSAFWKITGRWIQRRFPKLLGARDSGEVTVVQCESPIVFHCSDESDRWSTSCRRREARERQTDPLETSKPHEGADQLYQLPRAAPYVSVTAIAGLGVGVQAKYIGIRRTDNVRSLIVGSSDWPSG